MTRLKLSFGYQGSRYHGWQRQKNAKLTIQGVLEDTLTKLAGHRISLIASGRTDAGVHARVQVAHFDFEEKPLIRYQEGKSFDGFVQKLNAILPGDIRIFRIEKVDHQFHAQTQVRKKAYVYFINANKTCLPDLRPYTWHLRWPLNWEAITKAAKLFEGTHSFKAFCSSDSSAKTFVRTIDQIKIKQIRQETFWGNQKIYALRFVGKGFLKYQVRSMVGTLVKVGEGKIIPHQIEKALQTEDRSLCGPTASAQGLWLWDILY